MQTAIGLSLGVARTLAYLVPIFVGATPSLAAEASLCEPSDTIWFNAAVEKSNQLVSICGSEDVKGDIGWMQFRMGVPDTIAIAWPQERKGSVRAFTYRRYTRFRVTLLKLGFRMGDRDYAILEDDVSEDRPQYSLRLRVRKAGTETDIANHTLKPVTEPLSLMQLETYVRSKPYDE